MELIKRYSPTFLRSASMTTITAHNGCENTPLNSREHVVAAIASGADIVEIDLRYDGEKLYLSHDLPQDVSGQICFDSFLELVAPYPSLFINCDVKTEGLLELVMQAARRYGVQDRIIFTGQCNNHHKKIRDMGAELWYNLWFTENYEQEILDTTEHLLKIDSPIMSIRYDALNGQNIKKAQERGINFSAWTVDDEDAIRFLLKCRIANITTRKPALALKLRDEIQGTPEQNGLLPDGSIEAIIRQGGKIMSGASLDEMSITQKSGTANFVTEFDVKIQRFLEQEFKKLIPDCSFLAEEEQDSQNPLGDGYTFIIDPIDGTTNFMLGRRDSVISVGLLKDKKPVLGAIYHPYSDRYFFAVLGKGAYCNRKRIRVADRHPSVGLVTVGTAPYNKDTLGPTVAKIMTEFLECFSDIRRLGAAAIELCSIACGELDSFNEPVLYPWDYAAGHLLVTEAGGKITDFNGETLRFDRPCSVLAASPAAYEASLNILKGKL